MQGRVLQAARVLLRPARPSCGLGLRLLATTQAVDKGHNKWSNIRHIKGARDQENAKKYSMFANRVKIAIKMNGDKTDPDVNIPLRKLLAEAKAMLIPKSVVEGAIKKAAKGSAEVDGEFLWEIRGPGRAAVLVEVLARKKAYIPIAFNPIMRKHGQAQHELGLANMFERKGVILTALRPGTTLDDAETDGIEVGAEEVVWVEEEAGLVQFTTGTEELGPVQDLMVGLGYTVQEASLVYIPSFYAELGPIERPVLERMVAKLEELDMVMAVHHNAE